MNYGLQLFSLRDVAEKDFDEALGVAASLGFTSVEPAGFFGNDPDAVAAMLQKYGLGVPTTHTGLRELTENFDGVIKMHRAIGCNKLIFSSSKFKTKVQLEDTLKTVLYFQEKLEKEGMELMFHNHYLQLLFYLFSFFQVHSIDTQQ
jgi:sugar phosphate isomerase/epimerase